MRYKKTSSAFGVIASLLGLISPMSAETICTLTSEEEPDISITMKSVPVSGGGYGTLNYRNKPTLYFQVGNMNGYGTQYLFSKIFFT